MVVSILTGFLLSSAGFASAISCWSSTFSRPWFWRSLLVIATDAGTSGLWNRPEKSSPRDFQWPKARVLVEQVGLADHLGELAEAERRHDLAHFFRDEEEEVDHVLGLALELLAQCRVLRRDADRAGVQVALAHHDAAGGDQRRGREAELVGAEQRADDDVTARAHAAIDLHGDAAAQAIVDERLMRFGEADLPRAARVLDRGQRRRARAAFEAGDGDVVRARFGDAGRNRADADFGDELHLTRRPSG